MESILVVSDDLRMAYGYFYILAFLLAGTWLLYMGSRRGLPMVPWLITLMSCAVCAIVGSKLVLFSADEFFVFLQSFQFPATSQKTFLGGVLGGMLGLWLARKWLGLSRSVQDDFAFPLLGALAVGRIGCLLSGCCFGTPTGLPWGVYYKAGSLPYQFQLSQGHLGADAACSLAAHPAPLYEAIFCLVLICLLLILKKKHTWKAPGNLFCFSMIAYGCFRFLVEFVRAGGSAYLGLKIVQWGLLGAIAVGLALLTYRERHHAARTVGSPRYTDSHSKSLVFFSLLCVIIILGRNWFTPLEMTVLKGFSTIGIVSFTVVQFLTSVRVRGRVVIILLTFVPLCFLGFASQHDSAAPDSTQTSYVAVSGGGMIGQYEETCGGIHDYGVVGAAISYVKEQDKFRKLGIGIRGFVGTDEDQDNRSEFAIQGLNPFVYYDTKWIGLGVGGHFGDLYFDGSRESSFPAGFLRLGRLDKFFIEGHLANHSPGSWPSGIIKLGLGFGVGRGNLVRLGISDAGFYVNPYFTDNKRFAIAPFAAGFGNENTYQLSATLHLYLGR